MSRAGIMLTPSAPNLFDDAISHCLGTDDVRLSDGYPRPEAVFQDQATASRRHSLPHHAERMTEHHRHERIVASGLAMPFPRCRANMLGSYIASSRVAAEEHSQGTGQHRRFVAQDVANIRRHDHVELTGFRMSCIAQLSRTCAEVRHPEFSADFGRTSAKVR